MTLISQIKNIYQLLADDRIEQLGLFRVKASALVTPLTNNALSLFTHRAKRPDGLIDQSFIESLITAVKAGENFRGINHIGFCYKVDSIQKEVARITREASGKGQKVYQEPSNDDAAWIFVGDISKIDNPLLEFLPHHGQTNDPWVDYWLPHIQFDIDTRLSPTEIETLVKKFIQRPATPYPIQIDGVTYIQRVNLGCLEGVNIMLDISTNNRDINHRKTWRRLA